MNLAAGAAGTGVSGRTPIVILLAEATDFRFGKADFTPVSERLVVVEEYSCPESFRVEAQSLGAELPAPGNGFTLEIIADAEVAQHLEKSEVADIADHFNIGGAEALLT